MPPIGTISLDLEANTAQFHQEMGKARDTLGKTGGSFSSAEHAAASFATKGLGEAVPAVQGMEFGLGRLATSALNAGGALRFGGLAAIGFGTGLGAVFLEKKAIEFIALGTSVASFEERLKKAGEEQQKFFDNLSANIATNVAFAKEQLAALGQTKVLGLQSVGDTEGAIRAQRQAALDELEFEIKSRPAAGLQKFAAGKITAEQLAGTQIEIERTATAQRVKINAEAGKAFADLDKARLESEKASFLAGTSALLDTLQKRLDLRKQIEDTTKGLVEGGQIFDPFANADKVKDQATKEADAFALLLDKGRPWRDLQEQIFAKDQQFADQGFSGFAAAVENARGKLRDLGIDSASLDASTFALSKRLGDDMPAAINRADPAIIQLINRFQIMRIEANATNIAIQELAKTIAGGNAPPAPIVTPPVDLGLNP